MKPIHRITLSQLATNNLKHLAGKTGLSPNVVARFAMLVSFEQPDPPANDLGQPDLTINQTTLFGDLEPFLMTAFLSAATADQSEAGSAKLLAAHVARGAAFLNLRVSNIGDLATFAVK
jgi:DNA sulfur modification protein DndE